MLELLTISIYPGAVKVKEYWEVVLPHYFTLCTCVPGSERNPQYDSTTPMLERLYGVL